jgi:hypothetical protein
LNWNWDATSWKKSTKVLLGAATIWPIIYIPLFVILIFTGMFLGVMFGEQTQAANRLDLIQLEQKIQNGEIRELRVTATQIHAVDYHNRRFETSVDNESTREEIMRQARELDSNQRPRVQKVEENTSEPEVNPFFPIGFAAFFALHMFTILLSFALMPLYIILAVKNERLDQNMRIVWVVLTCTVGYFANPVYWYLHVWRTPPASPPSAPQVI